MLLYASVVGPANNPLYLASLTAPPAPAGGPAGAAGAGAGSGAGGGGLASEEATLRFHAVLHCALDVVDERLAAPRKGPGSANDSYLGLLYPTEDFRVYGAASATGVKLLLVADAATEHRDAELRPLFQKLHGLYADAVSNPFHAQGHRIESRAFDARVRALLRGL